jgi:hypothetical protein
MEGRAAYGPAPESVFSHQRIAPGLEPGPPNTGHNRLELLRKLWSRLIMKSSHGEASTRASARPDRRWRHSLQRPAQSAHDYSRCPGRSRGRGQRDDALRIVLGRRSDRGASQQASSVYRSRNRRRTRAHRRRWQTSCAAMAMASLPTMTSMIFAPVICRAGIVSLRLHAAEIHSAR